MVRLNWGSRARRPAGKRLVLLLAMLCLFAVAVRATSASSPKPRGQQQASDTDLICPTDNASDCYPRVFQATNEFQPVREDQDLPPGLHVRLNIWTGEKEAKLHNESDDDPATFAALEGLPVDKSVVLVDRPVAPEQDPKPDAGTRPKGAPAYDPVGLVKEPGRGGGGSSSSGNSGEGHAFYDAVAVIKAVDVAVAAGQAGSEDASVVSDAAERARFATALEQLDEFAHDIYYGVKLMEDEAATQSLLCLMSGTDAVITAQQAAAVVAAALQNNPTALRAVERTWDQHKAAVCPMRGATLGETVFGSYGLMPPDGNDDDDDNTQTRQPHAAWVRSRLLAVNGLLKSETILRDFLASEGLTQVLQVLVEQTGSEYEAARARAAHLVLDNFLDASMGADLSLWNDESGPTLEGETKEPADNNRRSLDCKAGPVHAGCWSYHARRWAEAHEDDETHWSGELWRRLQDRIRGGPPREAVGHDEL
ncbi:sls1 protein precursor-like protein [Niveomyces insectorum RCEF 264]|uniref:Nucleotide exchange factor SIL1 n=1 Tax=Niveomyces insectorum RCEF 264 TaxID=1081102 RepID=A0A167TUM2_9HYPO|nr:sls1 protein precursor-like protein [Niveomyces insectorum RCEF 264]